MTGERQEAEITRLVVRAAVEYLGRGPERAWVQITGDTVWVTLHETLTHAERNLVGHGRDDVVLQTRKALRRAMREPLSDGVAQITGRDVVAYLSDDHIEPTVSIAVFLLGEEQVDAQPDGT